MTAIDVIDSIAINATPEAVFNVMADYGNSAHSNTYQKLLKALKQHCESL